MKSIRSHCSIAMALLPLCTMFSAQGAEVDFATDIRPLLETYCFDCHAGSSGEANVDYEKFATLDDIRANPTVWRATARMLKERQMPPQDAEQPTEAEHKLLESWLLGFLRKEAEATAGDPGPLALRRLNNEEYNYTIRDLTGVDSLDPTEEFPIDGAGGEGFINTGAGQSMSPAMVEKYLGAAKHVAAHAVLLPTGIEFSASKSPLEWRDERVQAIRDFYHRFTVTKEIGASVDGAGQVASTGGAIERAPYLRALRSERDRLLAGETTIERVAREHQLHAKYLGKLWALLTTDSNETPWMTEIREKWNTQGPEHAEQLANEIEQLSLPLWKFNPIGQFTEGLVQKPWMEPVSPVVEQAEFREVFAPALCYSLIIPVDEVVTLVLFYREDELLKRLVLDESQARELDQLWDDLLYVAEEPVALGEALEQMIEFGSQDSEAVANFYRGLREPVKARVEAFREQQRRAEPLHVEAVIRLADRAWRRPLAEGERQALRDFYARLRDSEIDHDEAIRLTLARVLTSPAFLYRFERPAVGDGVAPVSSGELASRLSYFLWSSMPDERLRALADSGKLQDNEVLLAETHRMLADDRVRRLAIQFACQWLHVRDFDENNDKNERLFPEFAELRDDMYEETVLFFDDMFRNNGSVLDILQADHTFVNGTLARHYGIADVDGDQWRRVEGMTERGRGGVLGMASFLASQSGASRTSPILRGNWVYETLLGERLPRPPADVPLLPDDLPEGLTARQLIELHSADASCAKCHVKIDGFGFALERFDAIGRTVDDSSLDLRGTLEDGTVMDGMEGLRQYLSTTRRDDVVRQFCRKLLGFALGRETQLSDELLLDQMQEALKGNDYRVHVAIEAIVTSPQFRNIRGADFASANAEESVP